MLVLIRKLECSKQEFARELTALKTLVYKLKHHSLLGIHRLGFVRRNGEERGIKGSDVVLQKVASTDTHLMKVKKCKWEAL